jgi:CMP-N-acetylneuraminic acid synthetase
MVRKNTKMDHQIFSMIPARDGSEGVPRKSIKDPNGKPRLVFTNALLTPVSNG